MRLPGLLLLAPLSTVACSSPSAGPEPAIPSAQTGAPAPSPSASGPPAPRPDVLGDDQPVREGRWAFQGMVRPVKGGLEVRGVVLDEGQAQPFLEQAAARAGGVDGYLGAIVRVTGELVKHEPRPGRGGLAEQGREGAWFGLSKLEAIELVTAPVVVQGTLARSKGMWSIASYLVNRDDLSWSLVGAGGGREGQRVKLWGQPHVVKCDPRAQCLRGGELPLFAVGRAVALP